MDFIMSPWSLLSLKMRKYVSKDLCLTWKAVELHNTRPSRLTWVVRTNAAVDWLKAHKKCGWKAVVHLLNLTRSLWTSSGFTSESLWHQPLSIDIPTFLYFFSSASFSSLCLSCAQSTCTICLGVYIILPMVLLAPSPIEYCASFGLRVDVGIGAEGQACLSINQAWLLNGCSKSEYSSNTHAHA